MATTARPPTRHPQVLGVPGHSLSGRSDWAVNDDVRKIGKKGEERTAEALASIATDGGPTILHSLRLPMSGVDADIDHVVVAGRNVYVVDSKVWKPARYWTVGHVTRRGLERVRFADKHTSEMAVRALRSLLAANQVPAIVHVPTIVVWPSNETRPMHLGLYRPRGARSVAGEKFRRTVARRFPHAPADPAIVQALYPLVGLAPLAKEQPSHAAGASQRPALVFPRPSGRTASPFVDEF